MEMDKGSERTCRREMLEFSGELKQARNKNEVEGVCEWGSFRAANVPVIEVRSCLEGFMNILKLL